MFLRNYYSDPSITIISYWVWLLWLYDKVAWVTVGNNIYHIHYIHPDASLDNLTLSTTPVDHVVLALTYHRNQLLKQAVE